MTPTALASSTAAQQNVDAASATSPTPEQQKAACDFEAIFLRQLMSSLEKGSGLGGQSSGGQVFRSMMVGALADTASEGGGIGLRDLILKAMLPPAPQGKPDLASHAAVSGAAVSGAAVSGAAVSGAAVSHAAGSASGSEGLGAGPAQGGPGDPARTTHLGTARWGTASRVLTEARRAPMLEGNARGLAGSIPEGNGR
jgi:Rod binding domain-containing protein